MKDWQAQLRDRGHTLIGHIMKTGMKKSEVYTLLARGMQIPPNRCHFSQFFLREDIEKANTILVSLLFRRVHKTAKRRDRIEQEKRYKREVFTDKAVLQEVGRRNAERIAEQRPVLSEILSKVLQAFAAVVSIAPFRKLRRE